MVDKNKQIDRQISAFLAVRGHYSPKEDYWQIFRQMMIEINHLRMVIKYPDRGRRPGRQPTADLDRERYQHLLGFLVFKHSIAGEEAGKYCQNAAIQLMAEIVAPKQFSNWPVVGRRKTFWLRNDHYQILSVG